MATSAIYVRPWGTRTVHRIRDKEARTTLAACKVVLSPRLDAQGDSAEAVGGKTAWRECRPCAKAAAR